MRNKTNFLRSNALHTIIWEFSIERVATSMSAIEKLIRLNPQGYSMVYKFCGNVLSHIGVDLS